MDVFFDCVDFFRSDRYCFYRNVAAVVGVLWLTWLSLKTVKSLFGEFCAFILAPCGLFRTNLKKYGSWAVVTGASEGIGRGYALELARQGLNVVIMSRSEEKLQKVADEIKSKYNREVCIISVDFSEGMKIYPNIAEKLHNLDIGVLVNNVGLSYECPDVLHEQPADKMHKMIELNCQSMVQMSKLMLPKMLEKKKGIIVNLSSSSGSLNPPMLMCYGASKSFVNSFSEGLYKEYTGKGIIVQCVAPFFVATPMTGLRRSNLWIADAIQYTRSAVATIGIMKYTHGSISHDIQGCITSLLPTVIMDQLTWKAMKIGKARYLRKKSKSS